MKKICYGSLFVGLLVTPFLCFGGGENPPSGARSSGLGHASSALRDEWALFNNIAGIYSSKKISAMAAYQNLYGIPSLNQASFGMIFPYKEMVWGTTFYRFGDSYYNEIKAGIGLTHKIRNVSLGIKLNYHQIGVQELGVKRNLVIEFGGFAEITEQLFFGAHIYNLNQAYLNIKIREKKS